MNKGDRGNMTWALSKAKMEDLKIHASETAWVGTDFDAILDNNSNIDDLFTQVKGLVSNLPASTLHLLDEEVSDSLHTLS